MMVDYCGHQLVRRLMWVAPSYLQSISTTSHSLQCVGRPDWHILAGWDIWNISCLSGKEEVCEELRKRMIDVCCLQKLEWKGHGSRMLGMVEMRYMF